MKNARAYFVNNVFRLSVSGLILAKISINFAPDGVKFLMTLSFS